jgi:catechol 2,3-dioxygenase-like lactoylglutathione lyase family enzyme
MPLFFLPSFVEGANVVEFLTAATILPVKDVAAAVTRYTRLGFKGRIYDGALPDGRPIYAFLKRDRIDLHLALVSSLEPKANTSAVYLYVDDPDSLYREWSAVAHEGRLEEPEDREWGMREMTYSDPDGNLLRIGRFLTRSATPSPDHRGNKEHEGATEDEMQPTTPPVSPEYDDEPREG